jgi:heme-degrading monooxygenase HmoA
MILEVAILNVVPGKESAFEDTLKIARPLIAATPGFESIKIHPCIETPNRYLLMVTWRSIEDHTVGFRQSDRYPEWRKLLHHFYDPPPVVQHYEEALPLSNQI